MFIFPYMKWFVRLILMILISSCRDAERLRPVNVPQSAIWKGGVDGGVWVEFVSVNATTINANIFFENGGIWERGIFKKNGNCDIAESEIVEEIIGFDGNSLLTYKHCSFDK